jgi:hypothetical protein
LLGKIIETVSGQAYIAFLQQYHRHLWAGRRLDQRVNRAQAGEVLKNVRQ